MEADELFHLSETLQLLRLANLSEGDLLLTEAGKTFVSLGTDARKRLFAEMLLTHVPIVGLIRSVLDERPNHTAPSVRFRQQLEDYMSEDSCRRDAEGGGGLGALCRAVRLRRKGRHVQPGNPE